MSDIKSYLQNDDGDNLLPITDWSAIQNAPDFASQINSKIDQGAAVAYNSMVIDGNVDFNSITQQGMFTIFTQNGHSAGTHWPGSSNAASASGDWGMLLQWGHTNSTGLGVQLVVLVPGQVFVRSYDGDNGGYWENWKKLNSTDNP